MKQKLEYKDEKEETNEIIIADELEEDYIEAVFSGMSKFDSLVISCTNTHKGRAERIIEKFFVMGLLPENGKKQVNWNTQDKDIEKKGQLVTSQINSIKLYKRDNLTKFNNREPEPYERELDRVIIADKPKKIYLKRILDISQKSNQFLILCINTYLPNAERIVNECFTAGFHAENDKPQIQWDKSIEQIINKKGQTVNREVNRIKMIKNDELYKYLP